MTFGHPTTVRQLNTRREVEEQTVQLLDKLQVPRELRSKTNPVHPSDLTMAGIKPAHLVWGATVTHQERPPKGTSHPRRMGQIEF